MSFLSAAQLLHEYPVVQTPQWLQRPPSTSPLKRALNRCEYAPSSYKKGEINSTYRGDLNPMKPAQKRPFPGSIQVIIYQLYGFILYGDAKRSELKSSIILDENDTIYHPKHSNCPKSADSPKLLQQVDRACVGIGIRSDQTWYNPNKSSYQNQGTRENLILATNMDPKMEVSKNVENMSESFWVHPRTMDTKTIKNEGFTPTKYGLQLTTPKSEGCGFPWKFKSEFIYPLKNDGLAEGHDNN